MSSHRPVHTGHELSRARAHEGARGDRAPTPSGQTLHELMPGLQFPATREAILDCARRQNVERHLMAQLERLPDQPYPDAIDIARALSQFG
ncbi:DUF2795 domain-containing protein [Imbroritus primus]|uniref:DUF2795 domain-containing protein n=1 Tax=Imbroritus primus TaxID=3058603 RepID=A0ACD3SNE9_9BURK|nr:DUF2795 domain-containing protein [Burkholderiaceae bacterium PBA]